MNYIKYARQQLGFTQIDLVDETGLSLRTIQRLEADSAPPKGHSLRKLAEVFDLSPSELIDEYHIEEGESHEVLSDLKLINLSILGFLGIPFGNIILPMLVLQKKNVSPLVQQVGKQIINFQICFSIILALSLCIAPLISTSFPLILVVLFTLMGLNIIWVFRSAQAIQRNELWLFDLPIQLI